MARATGVTAGGLSRRAFLACGGASAALAAGSAARKKIVFVADRPSHGPGQHECNAGCLLLAKLLEESVRGIETAVYRNGWASGRGSLEGAAAVVLFTNGGAGHPAAPHIDELEEAMDRGAGLAVLHWGLDVGPGRPADLALQCLGGYYDPAWSVNPSWTARFDALPPHPVTRGVRPFAIFDEWYYHMRFRPEMAGVTPLLTAVPPDKTRERPFGPHSGNPAVRARKGMPEHLAWAAERPGGGRGFGFSGGHYHWSWAHDDYRKLVLNGLAWVSGIEMPEDGVRSRRPEFKELLENLDKPLPEGFTQQDAENAIRPR